MKTKKENAVVSFNDKFGKIYFALSIFEILVCVCFSSVLWVTKTLAYGWIIFGTSLAYCVSMLIAEIIRNHKTK